MNTREVIESLADLIERLQANNPEVDLGRRILHHSHLHFGYDDTREEIPTEIMPDSLELLLEIKTELSRRIECRREERFGVKVIPTPDGLKVQQCHRGCPSD